MDERYQEILNKVAELSMKLNVIKSSLREFEKQRINPRFDCLMDRIEKIENRMNDFNVRNEKFYDQIHHSTGKE